MTMIEEASLVVNIDGVEPVDRELTGEEFHAAASDLEADIEVVIANALADHPKMLDGATVEAGYVQPEGDHE